MKQDPQTVNPTPPELPIVTLQVVQDRSPPAPPGFLRLVRRSMVAIDVQGRASTPFEYDEVDRKALDAVIIAAHYVDGAGRRRVYLRSAARPPVLLRDAHRNAKSAYVRVNGLWELPAGLVEPDELTVEGIVRCAQRELKEELGFDAPVTSILPLGPSTFPCPGVIGERHYYLQVGVDPDLRQDPTLDGSAIERLGAVHDVALDDAIGWCREGYLEDAKTELGLRRLAELSKVP